MSEERQEEELEEEEEEGADEVGGAASAVAAARGRSGTASALALLRLELGADAPHDPLRNHAELRGGGHQR